MESLHIQPQLTDYVLGLLSYDEKKALEQHAALCDVCRQALERERLIAQTVRETLTAVPLPSPARLQQLMPQPPQKTKSWWAKQWPTIHPLVPALKPMAVL
ncbi:MAG: zf-HC2 domain-containing protein, partial [Anaerolineales bacterium]|nr:zf-HC2 domain-containing protein [Anaerolineales bacterium]